MPYISNSITEAKNPELIQDCSFALLDFANKVLTNESPIVHPNAGHRAYSKRTQLAHQILKNSESFGEQMARLVVYLEPNFVFNRLNNNEQMRRWLINNRTVESNYTNAATGSNPTNIGRQIFDGMAGVNYSDLI